MDCPKCSVPVGPGDIFCSNCGAQLRGTDEHGVVPRSGRGLGIIAIVLLNIALLAGSALLVYETLQRYHGTAQAATVRLGTPRMQPTRAPEVRAGDQPKVAAGSKAGPKPKGQKPRSAKSKASRAATNDRDKKRPKRREGKPDEPAKAAKVDATTPVKKSEPGKVAAPKAGAKATTPAVDAGRGAAKSASKPDAGVQLAPHERRAAEFNAQSVKRVIRHYLPQLRSCYERATKRGQKVGGLIEIRFTIGADGKVKSSVVHSNTTGATGLGKCIAATMKRWRFPKPVGGEVEFIYPFVFSSKR